MYKLLVCYPVLLPVAQMCFNALYFIVTLQTGRVSHNSLIYIAVVIPTVVPALKGDLVPFFEARIALTAVA